MKLSSGKFETVLDRICNAVYRHYVTLKGNAAVVVVGKNHLEKLNISPARFIQYSRETIPYLNDIAEIKVYHDGPKIILKFFLKEL
jgi:putative transposon-encoded protein